MSEGARSELALAMAAFYDDVDAAVAAHRPTCWNRGACCKFGMFGHRLYVTDLELAYFKLGLAERWRPPAGDDACPYQIDGLCTAREHRPLGCRIFFCDSTAQSWQGPEYERFLARLKKLGNHLGVEYRYREWLSALADGPEPDARVSLDDMAKRGCPTQVDGLKLPVIQ